jgi:pimeloyl-ACP methyl ester carboxylesterase
MKTMEESAAIKNRGVVNRVYEAFFSPSKYEVKSSEAAILERGDNFRMPYEGGELAVTVWGEGPAVLLMHGWGGGRAQMTGFVEPLLDAGFRAVAFDQPAHGESDGKTTNLLEIAPTMDLIAAQTGGSFEAIIAHSFGTLITSYALARRNFPLPGRLVYFGSFNRLMDSLPRFQVQANLPDAIMDGFRLMLYEKFGRDLLESITNEVLAPQLEVPALMFHDITDNVTPIEDSRLIAHVWKSARLVETEGLGHRGALQSPAIHTQVVDFLGDRKRG